jgi:beta-lactamase class A
MLRLAPRLLLLIALVAPARAQDAAPGASLEGRLAPLIAAHKGKVAVALKHLETGEAYRHRADVPMPTASLIKFPVMIEAYRQAAEGKVDLRSTVTLKQEDKVPGSGILTDHFSAGTTFPLLDAVHLMIAFSDNTATNLVLDAVGIPATAATMEGMGFPNTKVHSKVYRRDTSAFVERSKEFGLGSTTADDMVALFEKLQKKELVSPEACAAMRTHLLACDDADKFPRFLPAGTKVAFKTGSVDAARTAAGIIETPAGPVALCVLTAENEDRSWTRDNAGDRLCAEVAREVFAYYKDKGQAGPAAR